MRGTVLGLCTGLGRLGGVVGPVMVGLIIATPAGTTGVFWAFAGVGLLAALLVAVVPRSGLSDRRDAAQPVTRAGPSEASVSA